MSCDLAGPTVFHMLLGSPKVFLLPLAIPGGEVSLHLFTEEDPRAHLDPGAGRCHLSLPGCAGVGECVPRVRLLCGAAEEVNNVFFLPLCTLS